MTNSYEALNVLARQVRTIELHRVLLHLGARPDCQDKKKWHTSQGILSITQHQFMNWQQQLGGGGAIDLIMHLQQCEFKTAVLYLADHFRMMPVKTKPASDHPQIHPLLKLPASNKTNLPRIIHYLTSRRCLPLSLVNPLIENGKIYADRRNNAVFLLLGKEKNIVGAELRGVGTSSWKGLAKGSNKKLGGFYVRGGVCSKKIILCESAIDSMSCVLLNPCYMAISTSGATPNPLWLSHLIEKGYDLYCGFDADETGDRLAEKMISLHPSVMRLRPELHDWNDQLISACSKK